MGLRELFGELPLPEHKDRVPTFSSIQLSGTPHRLARDELGAPTLLIASASSTGARWAPIQLEHVTVQPRTVCVLWHDRGQTEKALFTIVRCRSADRVLRDYFLAAVEGTLPLLGAEPSEDRVLEVVNGLAELFRLLSNPPRKTVQGLWAELFILADATSPSVLGQGWHVNPEEKYDFSLLRQRLEVKSAIGTRRQHYFALEQLRPPTGTSAVVASVLLQRSGGGASISDLIETVHARSGGDAVLQARMAQVVASSLGENWRKGLEEGFDWERAQDSLVFMDSNSIPSLDGGLAPEISDVKFKVDLTGVRAIDPAYLDAAGDLFRAAIPLRAPRGVQYPPV